MATNSNSRTLIALPGKAVCRPGEELGRGAEAKVFALPGRRVAKLYHETSLGDGNRARLQQKVSRLHALGVAVKRRGLLSNVAWPEALLFDARDRFVGYVMVRVEAQPLHAVVRDPSWTLAERARAALELARTWAIVHELPAAVGDGSSNNTLVSRTRTGEFVVWFIDVDSFHIEGFPCRFATLPYVLPSVLRGEQPFSAGPDADNHALACLLFELLLGGVSPFAHRGGSTPESDVAKQFFPYVADQTRIPDGAWEVRWRTLPGAVQSYFTRAFMPRFGPRPTASEWTRLLSSTSVPAQWPDVQNIAPSANAAAGALRSLKRRLFDIFFPWRRTA